MLSEKTAQIPPYNELLWPTLEAVRSLGHAAMLDEIEPLWRKYQAKISAARKRNAEAAKEAGADPALSPEDEAEAEGRREELLEALLAMSPTGFEHLANRLLKTAGFVNTRVTGKSGDGGIDGVGTYRPSLVSFPIFFQCKRYKGSVGAEKVRDFRGAIQGRGERGLLITTGNFTTEAKKEAMREGAIPIDLIDGEHLCDLLKEFGLGIETTTRTIEEVQVQREFFADLS